MQQAQVPSSKINFLLTWFHSPQSSFKSGKLLFTNSPTSMTKTVCMKSSKEIWGEDSRFWEKSIKALARRELIPTETTTWSKRPLMDSFSLSRTSIGSRNHSPASILRWWESILWNNPSRTFSSNRNPRVWEIAKTEAWNKFEFGNLYCFIYTSIY